MSNIAELLFVVTKEYNLKKIMIMVILYFIGYN